MLLNLKPPSPIYFIVQQFLKMVVEFAMRYAFLSSMESRDAVYTFLYRFNDFKIIGRRNAMMWMVRKLWLLLD